MSLKRPIAWIAVLAVACLASVARAQTVTVSHASHMGVNPFIEPDHFGPDLQFFAPAQVDDYSGGEPPNTGFYMNYSRLFISITRPDGDDSLNSEFDGDFTWGNRFDFGYMTPERVGWSSTIWHIGGPNEYSTVIQERLDRRNEDDPSDGLDPGSTDNEPILQDRNPRAYALSQSLNVMRFSSFEFNRVWRRKEFHYGGILEPFIGLRHMTFTDFGRRDTYARFDDDAAGNLDLAVPAVEGPWEVYQTTGTEFQNNMLGAQLGFRLSKQTGHWLLSTELRMFALQNWQLFKQRVDEVDTRYDGLEGSDVEIEIRRAFFTNASNAEFVWGGEVRGEASYELTRDVNLCFGFVFLDLGQGIARGMTPQGTIPATERNNFQDVQMGGFTFGLTVNR